MKLNICFLFIFTFCCSVLTSNAQNVPTTVSAPTGSTISFPTPPQLRTVDEDILYNYTRSFTPMLPFSSSTDITESSPASAVKISTTYRDGFNNPMQTVIRNNSSNTKKNLVIPIDTRSRTEGVGYLPYPRVDNAFPIGTSLGDGYVDNPFSEQKNYYLNTYPNEGYTSFERTKYLSDAGQRSVITFAPGKSQVGQDRGTKVQSVTNAGGEVRLWGLNVNGLPYSNGFYPADALIGQATTSTEGAKSTTFKGKNGRVICVTSYLTDHVDGIGVVPVYGTTYNVYDEMERLRFTVPPAATVLVSGGTLTQAILDDLCYQYKYNDRGLLVEKKLPGKAVEYIVYDHLDRPVFSQDGLQRLQGKWSFIIYDISGRPSVSGTLTLNISRTAMVANVAQDPTTLPLNSVFHYTNSYKLLDAYPASLNNCDIETFTYYDDYTKSDAAGTIWATYDNDLQFYEILITPGSETPIRSGYTIGNVTGSRIKLFPAPGADPAKVGDWRETVPFYDQKGRVIYNVSTDYYQGNPIHVHYSGIQYDFMNRKVISKHLSKNFNSLDGEHKELERNFYDANTGSITQTMRKTNEGIWFISAKYFYDELGRVKQKVLGNYGEVRDFTYNIRGQLQGINGVYAETGNRQGVSRSFGEVLKYDYGFSRMRFDGLPSGMVWRGSNANNAMAYGYYYDKSGRLTAADFRTRVGSGTWNNTSLDFSVSNIGYDLNGNLKSMKQRGMGLFFGGSNTPVDMDKLRYDYIPNTNQLVRVFDTVSVDYHNGDFQNTNGTNNDYTYDVNGNLSTDANKGIANTVYNKFNKPETVDLGNGKSISYSYDAGGNKVQELVQDGASGFIKRTDYVGNYIYQDDKLQYALTTEGRSVFNPTNGSFKEQYFVKDHLGNVRSTVEVSVAAIEEYLATYELASANLEGLFFDHHDEIRDGSPVGGGYSGRLNGAESDRRVGTSILVQVMAGDNVEMKINNFYDGYNSDKDIPLEGAHILDGILSTLTAGVGGMPGEGHNPEMVGNLFSGENYAALEELINQSTDPNRPKAYLNYVLFDQDMNLVNEMSGAFQANGEGAWQEIGTSVPLEIPQNGFLAVYLTNATQQMDCLSCGDVYFDQLVLRFSRGSLKEEANYYPHGLPTANMTSTSNFVLNRHKYQGNEYKKELGLNWMDFHNRQYDPQLGRFLSVDPLAAATADLSVYAAMNNNPVMMVDPLGLQAYHLEALLRNTVSPVAMGLPSYGEKGMNKMMNNTPANAPGGLAGWYQQLSRSLMNDAFATAQAQAVKEYNARGELGTIVASDLTAQSQVQSYDGSTGTATFSNSAHGGSPITGFVGFTPSAPQATGGNGGVGSALGMMNQNNVGSGFFNNLSSGDWGNIAAGAGYVSGSLTNRFEKILTRNYNGSNPKSVIRTGKWLPYNIKVSSSALRITGNVLKGASYVAGGAGLLITGYQFANGQISGLEAGVDASFGVVGFFGWRGAAISIVYFGGKALYEYSTGETVFEKPGGQ